VISQGHYEKKVQSKETFTAVMDGRQPQLLMDIHTVSEVNDPSIDLSEVNGPATSRLYNKKDNKH
jgi:NADH-quinone oxidoreductase subunit G